MLALVLLTIGSAMIYVPAGFLVSGGLLLAYAIGATRSSSS